MMTVEDLQAALDKLDDGVLRQGRHKPGREYMVLDFASKLRGRAWSDAPVTLPDMRALNDALWSSDIVRTNTLLPVMSKLWDWAEWSLERQQRWVEYVIVETTQRIVLQIPFFIQKYPGFEVKTVQDVKTWAAEAALGAAGAALGAAGAAQAARRAGGAAAAAGPAARWPAAAAAAQSGRA